MRKLLLFCCMLFTGFGAGAQCVASFSSATAPLNNQLLRVQFTNTSSWGLPFSGQIRYAKIYYGDGNTALIGTTSPAHVYATPGTYTVSLVIESIDSATSTRICKDSIAQNVTINYTSCGTIINVSGFGLSRTFSANTPAGNFGMTYTWDFGDGSATASGSIVSHTYATNGIYPVTLTATRTSPACSYTNVLNTHIYIPPSPLNCASLNASFTTSVSSNMLTTNNTSSTVSAPYKMDTYWNYGDGTPVVSGFNVLPHAYTSVGIYSVKLLMVWRDSLSTTVCKDSITQAIAVTSVPPTPNVISGTVSYDTLPGTNYFKVWLIRYDSATNFLTAVDSQITANTALAYYAFANKPAGSYRTKAAVHLGSTGGTGIIPTYHDSDLYWNTANVIKHLGFSSLNKNIAMQQGTTTTGPGFIGGNVSLGANKGTAAGVANMIVYLRNPALKVIKATYTDANGDYGFDDLPIGAYSVYPEDMNYYVMPATPIALTPNNPENHNVDFNQDLAKRSIARRASLGIASGNFAAGSLTVFPNPASGTVTIAWKGQSVQNAQFVITGITGNVVARSSQVSGNEGSVDIDIAGLAQGVYFVHGSGALAGQVTKLIVR